MAKNSHLPKYNEFLNPLFQALHDQIAVNSGPDRFSTIFIHYARFDAQRPTREATRDGATPIDLMDGDQLADKLKELRLGIKPEIVDSVEVDADWFKNI